MENANPPKFNQINTSKKIRFEISRKRDHIIRIKYCQLNRIKGYSVSNTQFKSLCFSASSLSLSNILSSSVTLDVRLHNENMTEITTKPEVLCPSYDAFNKYPIDRMHCGAD